MGQFIQEGSRTMFETIVDVKKPAQDLFIDPLDYVIEEHEALAITGIKLASKIGDRARFGDTVDSILYDSADSYAQTRLLYLNHRWYELGMEGGEIDPYDPYEE